MCEKLDKKKNKFSRMYLNEFSGSDKVSKHAAKMYRDAVVL